MGQMNCGSMVSLCWSPDGTVLGAGGTDGSVHFVQVLGRRLEWRHVVVEITDTARLQIKDILHGHTDTIGATFYAYTDAHSQRSSRRW
jgi:hypothetical protein